MNFKHLDHLPNWDLRDMRDKLHSQGFLTEAMDLNNYIYLRPSVADPVIGFDDDDPNS